MEIKISKFDKMAKEMENKINKLEEELEICEVEKEEHALMSSNLKDKLNYK